MPPRSNEFQKLIKYIYSKISPVGARVKESAELREDGTGAKREVDILIELAVAGLDIKIAIECRDRSRDETVGWIDELIGKFSRLRVNKIVAVSSNGFSDTARAKAEAHGIETLTILQAHEVDWAARLAAEFFDVMTHKNMLMRVGAYDQTGAQIASTEIDEHGKITHKDRVSEGVSPALLAYFVHHVQQRAGQEIEAFMSKDWQRYFTDPTPRYCEFTANLANGEIILDGKSMRIERLVFGCGTVFEFSHSKTEHWVLKDHMLSHVPLGEAAKRCGISDGDLRLNLVTERNGRVMSVELSK